MGFLHAADQVNNVWRETIPIDLVKTPIGVYVSNPSDPVGQNQIQYGIWIANDDGTIDFFGREAWEVQETITLPEGARPEYILDLGEAIFVCDSALGAIYTVQKDDLTYTTYTTGLEYPQCIEWLGSGFFAISQANGYIARTNLAGTTTTVDTGYIDSGYIAAAGQGPGLIHLIVVNSANDVIQIVEINNGAMSILATESATIPRNQAMWCHDDSRVFHGDSSNNLVIRDSYDLSVISTNSVGIEVDYLYRGNAEKLYFASSDGKFGCWDVQNSELMFNDGEIEGGCCGIAVPEDIIPV